MWPLWRRGYGHVVTAHQFDTCAGAWFVWCPVSPQLMMDGKKVQLSPDDYVFAALNLYIDVVNLFLFLLELFGRPRNN